MEACLPGIGQEEEAVFAKKSPRLMGVRIKDGPCTPISIWVQGLKRPCTAGKGTKRVFANLTQVGKHGTIKHILLQDKTVEQSAVFLHFGTSEKPPPS